MKAQLSVPLSKILKDCVECACMQQFHSDNVAEDCQRFENVEETLQLLVGSTDRVFSDRVDKVQTE